MANLEPEVQVKLIDISKEWAEKISKKRYNSERPSEYPKEFDGVYKQLAKTVSGAISGK
jgi:hypothetical protein